MIPRAIISAAVAVLTAGPVVAVMAKPASLDPQSVHRARSTARIRKEQIEAHHLEQTAGLNYNQQAVLVENLRAKRHSAAAVRKAIAAYQRTADRLQTRTRGSEQRVAAVAVFRLMNAAYEILIEKTSAKGIACDEWLHYAEVLGRFDFALNAYKRAAAYKSALKSSPSASQEKAALRGYQHALILADQAEPGKHTQEIVGILNTFREKHPESSFLNEALLATGDHLRARGRSDEARQCYSECVARFGVRARAAGARLQQLP